MIVEYVQITEGCIREKLVNLSTNITTINQIGKTEENSDQRPVKTITLAQEQQIRDLLYPFVENIRRQKHRLETGNFEIKSMEQYRFFRMRLKRAEQVAFGTDFMGIHLGKTVFVLPSYDRKLIIKLPLESSQWEQGFEFRILVLNPKVPPQ